MNDVFFRSIWIVAIILILLFIYLIYIGISVFFMRVFSKKIETTRQVISVVVYQKYESLDFTAESLIKLGYSNAKLEAFAKADEYKEYKSILAKEFDESYKHSEEAYGIIKSVCLNLKISDNLSEIKSSLQLIDALNSKYFESVQLYNTYVIGYNYWRNLFFTKWIKILFKKEEIETIK